jgi:hypothetical protein
MNRKMNEIVCRKTFWHFMCWCWIRRWNVAYRTILVGTLWSTPSFSRISTRQDSPNPSDNHIWSWLYLYVWHQIEAGIVVSSSGDIPRTRWRTIPWDSPTWERYWPSVSWRNPILNCKDIAEKCWCRQIMMQHRSTIDSFQSRDISKPEIWSPNADKTIKCSNIEESHLWHSYKVGSFQGWL